MCICMYMYTSQKLHVVYQVILEGVGSGYFEHPDCNWIRCRTTRCNGIVQ